MTIKQFRTISRRKKRYEIIPVDLIRLVSDIHMNTDVFHILEIREITKPTNQLLVIAHKNEDGTFNLITGWRDYAFAVWNDIKEIKAVLVDEVNRDEFLHWLSASTDWVKLDDIHIPDCFSNSPPKKEKLNDCVEDVKTAIQYHSLTDYLDVKPIKIDKNNVLTDGYTRYLALKSLEYKDEIPVIRKD